MPSWLGHPDDLQDPVGTDSNTVTVTSTGTAMQSQLMYPIPVGAAMGGASAVGFPTPPPPPNKIYMLNTEFTAEDFVMLKRLLNAFKKHGLPAPSNPGFQP